MKAQLPKFYDSVRRNTYGSYRLLEVYNCLHTVLHFDIIQQKYLCFVGLEKIDHLDFIQVPTEMAGTPDDETDAVRGSGAGGSFSYQVTRAKTTITSTRSDLPDPYGDRHRSTVTGTEVSSTNEGGALGDSALSLNHERSKESTQLFIVALHVGLKHKKIAGEISLLYSNILPFEK